MSVTLRLEELIAYSDHERAKWRGWIAADRARLQIPFQPGGRFPTLGSVFDHVFLVERRHLARLEGAAEKITFTVGSYPIFRMTRRKLALTIMLHETRHLAQAAMAARTAGHEPPGEHDLLFFTEFA